MTVTKANKEAAARCHRTQIIIRKKTNVLHMLEITRIFRDIATTLPGIFD